MSTRALFGIYLNGTLQAKYFHHWDGYLSVLGNTLILFNRMVRNKLNNVDAIMGGWPQKAIRKALSNRSPIDMLKPLLDFEGGFEEDNNFDAYWVLNYIYRVNFVFHPTKGFHWDANLEYTDVIGALPEKWKDGKKFIPLVYTEGVHYKTEGDKYILPKMKKYLEPIKLENEK